MRVQRSSSCDKARKDLTLYDKYLEDGMKDNIYEVPLNCTRQDILIHVHSSPISLVLLNFTCLHGAVEGSVALRPAGVFDVREQQRTV